MKPKSPESRQNFFFSFLLGKDAPHVYVRAWMLCCFHSLISTQTFRRALAAPVDSCAEIKSAPSVAVINSGRVWRKVPGSGGRIVASCLSFSLVGVVHLKVNWIARLCGSKLSRKASRISLGKIPNATTIKIVHPLPTLHCEERSAAYNILTKLTMGPTGNAE